MLVGLCLLFLIALIALRVFIVRFNEEKTARVIERMGKFHRTITKPGVYFRWPFIDSERMCVSLASFKIDPRPLRLDKLSVDIVLVARITDPVAFCYEKSVALDMIRTKAEELTRAHFQNAENSLFTSQTDARGASEYITTNLKELASAYGVSIEQCTIENIRQSSTIERQTRKLANIAAKLRAKEESQVRTNALLVAKAEADACVVRKFLDVTQMTTEEYLRYIHIISGKKVIDELLEKDLIYFHPSTLARVSSNADKRSTSAVDAR